MRGGVVMVSLMVILVSSILTVNPNFVFAQNNPPGVDYIKAVETTELHTTYYQLFFTDPTHPDPDGDLITITWSISNSCGNFFFNANYATWEHPVSSCGNDPVQSTITAIVNDGHGNVVIRTYDKGSVTGTGSLQGPTSPNGSGGSSQSSSSNSSGSVSNLSSANSGQGTGLQTTTTTSQNATNKTNGPNIVIIGLLASPKLVKIGEPVTFIVRVKNIGDEPGSRNLSAQVVENIGNNQNFYRVDGSTPTIPADGLPYDVSVLKWKGQYESMDDVTVEDFHDAFKVLGLSESSPGFVTNLNQAKAISNTDLISIKNSASLWADGKMSDKDFAKMVNSHFPLGPIRSTFWAPHWFKNDASLWVHDEISDNAFVNAMNYLNDKVILPHVPSPP